MVWKEGFIHLAMRRFLRQDGWFLIAGEFPGGSDHELYPLNVVDPKYAKDCSPDPRRHSLGELIPDLVALKNNLLIIAEAKPTYDKNDFAKLECLIGERRDHLLMALQKFAMDRNVPELLPLEKMTIRPIQVFPAHVEAPRPLGDFSYLRIVDHHEAYFEGTLAEEE